MLARRRHEPISMSLRDSLWRDVVSVVSYGGVPELTMVVSNHSLQWGEYSHRR